MTQEPKNGEDELQYIKFSAKELLAIQNGHLLALQADVTSLRLELKDIAYASVTRAELTTTRRWAVSAAIAGTGALMVALGLILRAVGA